MLMIKWINKCILYFYWDEGFFNLFYVLFYYFIFVVIWVNLGLCFWWWILFKRFIILVNYVLYFFCIAGDRMVWVVISCIFFSFLKKMVFLGMRRLIWFFSKCLISVWNVLNVLEYSFSVGMYRVWLNVEDVIDWK